MRKRLSLVLVLATVLALTSAAAARADTTLGSTSFPLGATPEGCGGNAVIAETASDPSTPYTVPSPGTITSWQVNATPSNPGNSPITLVVLRSLGGISYQVVGVDTHALPNPPPAVASFTVSQPIAVNPGDILALFNPAPPSFFCYYHGGTTPSGNVLIALASASTPVPGQGLVLADSSGPGFRLNLSATLKPPVHKKKCKKKKKKKHSAESAKKKKCKKKKKH